MSQEPDREIVFNSGNYLEFLEALELRDVTRGELSQVMFDLAMRYVGSCDLVEFVFEAEALYIAAFYRAIGCGATYFLGAAYDSETKLWNIDSLRKGKECYSAN